MEKTTQIYTTISLTFVALLKDLAVAVANIASYTGHAVTKNTSRSHLVKLHCN